MPVLGVVTVGSATLAMLWTYVYNWGFDQAMQRLTGGTQGPCAFALPMSRRDTADGMPTGPRPLRTIARSRP